MARLASTWIALLLFVACGEDPPPAPPPSPVEPAPDPEPACERGPIEVLFGTARGRGGLAIRDGWVAALDDVLQVRDPEEERHEVTDGRMTRLLGIASVGGGPLVVALGTCEEDAHCLIARDPMSEAVVEHALPSELVTSRRAITDDAFYLAWSGGGGTRGLERFTRSDDGLRHDSLPLGDEEASDEAPTEILGMAAHDESWAVVWRRGATEDASSRVHITSADAHRPSEALHDAVTIESISLDDDGLSLVAGFELARPGFVRFGSGDPELRPLSPEDSVPAPLTDQIRAVLDIDELGLWLRRRSPAGDQLGERAQVIAGNVEMATLERRGDAFFVVWAAPDRRILGRDMRCAN